jgi:hypothetical protein
VKSRCNAESIQQGDDHPHYATISRTPECGANKKLFQQFRKQESGHQTKVTDERFGIMELGIRTTEKCPQTHSKRSLRLGDTGAAEGTLLATHDNSGKDARAKSSQHEILPKPAGEEVWVVEKRYNASI